MALDNMAMLALTLLIFIYCKACLKYGFHGQYIFLLMKKIGKICIFHGEL